MSSILQGTTPSLEIKISTDDFLVTEVTALELTFPGRLDKTSG